MNLWLIRHCESVANANANIYAEMPNIDIPLSDEGKMHAIEVGDKVSASIVNTDNIQFLRTFGTIQPIILVSPFLRAKQTAQIIAEQFEKAGLVVLDIIEDILLSEQNYGAACGCESMDEFTRKSKQTAAINLTNESNFQHLQTKLYYQFPQGESRAQSAYRAETMLNKIKQFSVSDVVIVSHKNFLCMMDQQIKQTYANEFPWENGEYRSYRSTSNYGFKTFKPMETTS